MSDLVYKPVFGVAPRLIKNGESSLMIPPFIPEGPLIGKVNSTLRSKWPLLLIGDKVRREYVSRSVGYHLFGDDVLIRLWSVPVTPDLEFREAIYLYDHESRKRDLSYYQVDPEHNKLRLPEFYFKKGPILEALELMVETNAPAIIDFLDCHKAGENFIHELTTFFASVTRIYIPEIEYELEIPADLKPIIFLTADEGYQIPEHLGVVYQHEMRFPSPEILAKEISLIFHGVEDAEGNPYRESGDFDRLESLIFKHVQLFFQIRDNRIMNPERAGAPLPLLRLIDSMDWLIRGIVFGEKTIESALAEVDEMLNSHESMKSEIAIPEIIRVIRQDIQQNRMDSAAGYLEMLSSKLEGDDQHEIIMLISNYHDISNKEKNGLEVPYFLIPEKNRLKMSILSSLKNLEEDNSTIQPPV